MTLVFPIVGLGHFIPEDNLPDLIASLPNGAEVVLVYDNAKSPHNSNGEMGKWGFPHFPDSPLALYGESRSGGPRYSASLSRIVYLPVPRDSRVIWA